MFNRLVLLLALFLITLPLRLLGQEKSTAQIYLDKADSLSYTQYLDSALYYTEEASKLFLEDNDSLNYFSSQISKIGILRINSLFKEAESEALKLLELGISKQTIETAKVYRQLGIVYESRDGDYARAQQLYKKGLSLFEGEEGYSPLQAIIQTDIVITQLSLYELDSAEVILNTVLSNQRKFLADRHIEIANTLRLLARVHDLRQDHNESIKSCKAALDELSLVPETPRALARKSGIYSNMASTYASVSDYDSAIFYQKKSKALLEAQGIKDLVLARTYVNIGINLDNIGALDSAIYYTNKGLSIMETNLDPQHPSLASGFHSLAIILSRKGLYEESKKYDLKALEIINSAFPEGDLMTSNILIGFSQILIEMGSPQEAINYLNQGLALTAKLENNGVPIPLVFKVNFRTSLTEAHLSLEHYTEALNQAKLALVIASEAGADIEWLAEANTYVGKSKVGLGEFKEAKQYLEAALEGYKTKFGSRHITIAFAHAYLADLAHKTNNLDRALMHIQNSINSSLYPSVPDLKDITSTPKITELSQSVTAIEHMRKKAELLEAKAINEPDENWLQLSYDQYSVTLDLLLEYLENYNLQKDLLVFGELSTTLHQKLLALLPQIVEKNEVIKAHWRLSEQAKAISISLNRLKSDRSSFPPALENLVADLDQINSNLSFYKSQLSSTDTESSTNSDNTANKVFRLERDYSTLREKIRSEYPSYFNYRYNFKSIPLENAQQKLQPNQALIEYFQTDSLLYTIVLTYDSSRLSVQPLSGAFDVNIRNFKKALTSRSRDYAKPASELYQLLVQPFESLIDQKTQLIIIPHRQLWSINFDLLLTEPANTIDPGTHDFLLKKYGISYAYSATLLFEKRNQELPRKNILAFAFNEDTEKASDLNNLRDAPKSDLPGTAVEVRNLSNDFSGDYFYDSDATEQRFKAIASDYRILHLALHGEVDNQNFDNSKLYFKKSANDTIEDSFLHSFELYSMKLNTQLAVLSACNTGDGEITSGEGVMSLGRAFQYAGVNSLLLSQWEVSDATTPVIMRSFYKHLKEGKNKAEALRLAKLEYLETADNLANSPFFWGSFFILGDTSPIELKDTTDLPKGLLLGIVLILGLIFLIIAKKRVQKA